MGWLVVGGSALLLSGCMADDDRTPIESASQDDHLIQRQEIMGGQTDTNSDYEAVVGMFMIKNGYGGICSGTLIAPNLVLTAQHCVAEVPSQYVQCGRTTFGSKYDARDIYVTTKTYMTQNTRDYINGAEVHVPPGGSDMCGYDIALIILNNKFNNVTPIIPRLDQGVRRAETYTAVGYGHTGNGSGSGTRRFITGRQVQCGGTSPCSQYGLRDVTNSEFLGTDGTCQGDSGGAPLDSQGRVLGALSRGPDGCRASVYSSVASWGPWVRQVAVRAAQMGNYTAPAWASGAAEGDIDFDGIDDEVDNCPNASNPDQEDVDGDGIGDVCDSDVDGDGIAPNRDNCPDDPNPDQADFDNDGYGDVCDRDADGDGTVETNDNCPLLVNNDQADSDNDGIGDACDDTPNGDQPGNNSTGNNNTGNNNAGNNSTGNNSTGNSDPGNTSGGSGQDSEDEQIIILLPADDDSNNVDDGGCSVASSTDGPAPGSVGLGVMLLGLFGLRRRQRR